MTETETALEVVDQATGEIIDVRGADPERLADFVDGVDGIRTQLAAMESIVLGELLRRLDRRGEWTWRVGDPKQGVLHTITAPSPTAGSTAIRLGELRDELRRLVADDEIDPELAEKALKRTVTITATVGTDVDLEALRGRLEGIDAIAGVPVADVVVETDEKVAQNGVNALRKAGLGAVVEKCTTDVEPPARKAKVKTERRPA